MKNNSLQKKITKNQLLQNDTQLIRVLDIEADRVFIIDCIKCIYTEDIVKLWRES